MIHEEICTYEVCMLAKEKGFNEKCYHYYQKGILESDKCFSRYNKGVDSVCSAPTQSLLQRWLRENHGADVWVDTAATMATKNQRCYYWHIAYDSDGSCIYILDSMLSFPTYEKALEEGLKEAIIEFVEEKR